MELKEILTPRLLSVTEINLIGFILLSFLIYFKLTDIQTTYIKLSHCIQLHQTYKSIFIELNFKFERQTI